MDNETKQLYKTVVKDLSGKAIIKATPARVSFAVANLFKGIRDAHHRNVERLKNLGINMAATAGNVADTISANFQNLVQNNESKREFVNSFAENDMVQEAIDNKVESRHAEDVQRKEELLASIQRDNRLVNAGAGFIVDTFQADVEKLKERVIKEKTKPHRLLVNKMFLNQFKDAAAAKRIRLRERKKLKIAVAKEVRNFDNVVHEIRKRYSDNPAMSLEKIEEERMKLGNSALDFVTLREGLGHGVTDKEVWGAYFIGIDEMEVGIPTPEVAPVEPAVEEPIATPVEPTITPEQTELYERLANAVNVRAESLSQEEPVVAPVEPTVEESVVAPVEPTVEEPVATPVEPAVEEPVATPVEPAVEEPVVAPIEPAVEEPVATPVEPAVEEPVATPVEPAVEEPVATPVEPAIEEPVATPVEQPINIEHNETETLLGGIDTLRAGYRNELNDGYNYTEAEKKEWEDARLAEDIVSKDNNLSYEEQEATVLSYEQGLKEQREAIVEMEKQLAIIKSAEQKIAELTKTINPDLLKQVKGEAVPEQAAPEIEPEGISR